MRLHINDDQPPPNLLAAILDLDSYDDHPDREWREIMLESAHKAGLLVGAGFLDQFSAQTAVNSPLKRRLSSYGAAGFDVDAFRALVDQCSDRQAEGERTARSDPASASYAFPLPDFGLFGAVKHRTRIRASTLPKPFARLIDAQTENTGLPTSYLVMSWLTAAAGLIGTAREISPAPNTYSEPALLWTAIVGEPSDKKSPAIDLPSKLVGELDVELHPVNERCRKDFARDLARYNAEQKAFEASFKTQDRSSRPALEPPDRPDEPEQKRLVIGNVTPEKLIALFSDNPRGLIGIFDELPGFWRSFNTYAQGDGRQLALKAYGGRPGQLDRVKFSEPLLAERCALTVLGGVQTDVLRSAIEKDENDGFYARFLYVFPSIHEQRLGGGDLPVAPVRAALARLWCLERSSGGDATLYLAAEARDAFLGFRTDWERHSRLRGPGLNGWVAKGPGTVLRIALVLELMKWASGKDLAEPQEVSAESFQQARDLWEEHLLEHAERVFGYARRTPADDDARRLATYLAESGDRIVNASMIRERRAVPGLARSETVKAAFERLVDAGIVFPHPRRGGEQASGRGSTGRARLDYLVNPRINEMMIRIAEPEAA